MTGERPAESLESLRAELAIARQQLADASAAQEAFLQSVSHDLRAPLRHVTSYGSLVRELLGDLPPAVREAPEVQEALGFLATMGQSSRRMALMLDGLLALVQVRRAPLAVQPVVLATAVAQAQVEVQAQVVHPGAVAGPTDGAPVWHIDPALPSLAADPGLLHGLLVQLLGNALKFTRSVAQPRISVHADAAPLGWVAFTVQDNGVGFDPARAGGLLGMFQRAHRDGEFEGVGAGLALSRAIAERHGGQISVSAVLGQGCSVRVLWPVPAPGC